MKPSMLRSRRAAALAAAAFLVSWTAGAEEASPAAPQVVPSAEAAKYIGQEKTVEGAVTGVRFLEKSEKKPTFLNFGEPFPKHHFTVVIPGADRAKFTPPPEEQFKDKTVRVTGVIADYKGKPQIVVADPAKISIVEQPSAPAPAPSPAAQ